MADNNLFPDNKVNFETLFNLRVINKKDAPLKILGNGELKTALTIEAHSFSASAKQKIESVGGVVIVNE